PLKAAFDALKLAIASQERANRLTANLHAYLQDVLQKNSLASQVTALNTPQTEARTYGTQAANIFGLVADGKPYAQILTPLVNQDMAGVQADLRSLNTAAR